ncbi:RNA polymerase sigma factor [Microbacterium sp. A93]|uniref:RNA polymerase sigma factor n=1 Tax=Microbacterium sp. A93 TaxID=3450716 RepID=UPI003F41D254
MVGRNHDATSAAEHARFDELVRANEDDLLRYLQRRLANGADAAEAFGEVLYFAWKLRRKVPVDSTEARMWLFASARNVMLNSRRTRVRRSAAVERLASEMTTSASAGMSMGAAVEIRAAIDALPTVDAELVRLTYWDGFASHEAAAILGLNASTARSRLAKAREFLRNALDPTLANNGLSTEPVESET